MKNLILLSVLLGLAGAGAPPAGAAGLIIVDESQWLPGPMPPHPTPPRPPLPWPPGPIPPPPRPYPFAPLEVDQVQVRTRINDQLAVTAIEQEFYNPNPTRLEGTFLFPIPKGAQLDKFSMEIDGKPVEAELLNADKARGIYENIVRKAKDPALLEYAGRDVFKVRIFPIEPNSRKRIKLSYTQLLKSEDGLISYVLPLSTEKFSAKPIKTLSVQVDLESKRPLKAIYSPSHSTEIKRRGPNGATVGYEASPVQPDTDFALYFAPEKDELGVNLLTYRTHHEDGYFLLLAAPGLSAKADQIVHKDIVFVLDTSGSMAGKKLDQAKKALQFCVENLNDGDRFEILRFSTEVEPLFNQWVEASHANRARAAEFIKDLKPIGGTAIDEALHQALDLSRGRREPADAGIRPGERPSVVIFLTDGRPTIGSTDEDQIVEAVRKRGEGQTRVFCFGIGTDVNTHLLDRITEATRGYSQYVLPEEDLELKVSGFFSKIKTPVLSNPTLQVSGGIRTSKLYPSPLPDLFNGEQLVLVGRYTGDGDSAVLIEGSVNGPVKKFTYEVKFPDESAENDFLPRLWATRRVGYLLDEIRLHGESSELREEVTDLARQFGIVTPYTAYLIVEDETRRNVPVPMQSFRNFQSDGEARREAAANWNDFKSERGGEKGVASARYGLALKAADASAPAAAGGALESQRALGFSETSVALPDAAFSSGKARLVEYARQTRFVAGRNFFQNNRQWVDSTIQKHPDAKRVRIQFGSAEYFDFATQHPQASPWLALGQNVQFALDSTIYEIYE